VPAATPPDCARAARVLTLRSRRAATGLLAGSYASAFRGNGLDFEESLPYVPGDDVRHFDWNALARTGEPFVKHFREERNRLLLIALDDSASMHFPARTRSKAAQAALCATLLAAAASRVGDRVGFLRFAGDGLTRVEVRRSPGQVWRVARAASQAHPGDRITLRNSLETGVRALHEQASEGSIVVLLSDYRDPGSLDPLGSPLSGPLRQSLRRLAKHHDVVCGVLDDRLERDLPKVGTLHLRDPENPDRVARIATSDGRLRRAVREAHQQRNLGLARQVRACGAEPFWLWTHREALQALLAFFERRAAGQRRAGAP